MTRNSETKCPSCSDVIPSGTGGNVCPACNADIENEKSADDYEDPANDYVSRLPRKFLADDPEFFDRSIRSSQVTTVLLPDGEGGVTSIKSNIVRIQHKGKTIELVALSPEQKRKRQFWVNVVSITLGAMAIVLFFWFIN